MQVQFERSQGMDRKLGKQVIAIELLLNHPDWSDERIAANVPTTMKQLRRMTDFNALRRVPIRMAVRKAAEGE